MIVDEMHAEHPELVKDQFWDEVTLQRILPKPNKTYKEKFAGYPRRATLHRGSWRIPNWSVAWVDCRCSCHWGTGAEEKLVVVQFAFLICRESLSTWTRSTRRKISTQWAMTSKSRSGSKTWSRPCLWTSTRRGRWWLLAVRAASRLEHIFLDLQSFRWRSRWWRCKRRTSRTSPGRSCRCCTRSSPLPSHSPPAGWTALYNCPTRLDSAAVSVFVVILVELTNTVFVFVFINSTNITTNIETAVLSKAGGEWCKWCLKLCRDGVVRSTHAALLSFPSCSWCTPSLERFTINDLQNSW